jgi:hypothetical protein
LDPLIWIGIAAAMLSVLAGVPGVLVCRSADRRSSLWVAGVFLIAAGAAAIGFDLIGAYIHHGVSAYYDANPAQLQFGWLAVWVVVATGLGVVLVSLLGAAVSFVASLVSSKRRSGQKAVEVPSALATTAALTSVHGPAQPIGYGWHRPSGLGVVAITFAMLSLLASAALRLLDLASADWAPLLGLAMGLLPVALGAAALLFGVIAFTGMRDRSRWLWLTALAFGPVVFSLVGVGR